MYVPPSHFHDQYYLPHDLLSTPLPCRHSFLVDYTTSSSFILYSVARVHAVVLFVSLRTFCPKIVFPLSRSRALSLSLSLVLSLRLFLLVSSFWFCFRSVVFFCLFYLWCFLFCFSWCFFFFFCHLLLRSVCYYDLNRQVARSPISHLFL